MAIIKNNGNGDGISGSLGGHYYKIVNGVQILCSKPARYTLPKDARSTMIRETLKMLSQLASKVTKNPYFRQIWSARELKGVGPFHKFFSFNHPHKNPFFLSNAKLAPASGFKVEADSFGYDGYSFKITLKPFDETSGINPLREPFVSIGGFVIDENEKTKKSCFAVYELRNTKVPVDVSEPVQVTIPVLDIPSGAYKVLLLVTTLSSTEQQVRYSETIFLSQE